MLRFCQIPTDDWHAQNKKIGPNMYRQTYGQTNEQNTTFGSLEPPSYKLTFKIQEIQEFVLLYDEEKT